jgi:N utilization substance protein A
MAKRKSAKSGASKQLIIDAFAEMARQKNIDRDLLQGIIVDTFAQMVHKKYGPDANFDTIVNMEKGDIEIYLLREVVEEVEDPNLQISLEEANAGDEQYDIGDEHLTELNLENLAENFGRRMVSMASQLLGQRIREVEKDNVVAEYGQKVNEIIVGEVYQVRRNDVYVMHNKVELRMPRNEQIWRERYKKGDTIRALLKEVRSNEGTASQPEIIISRSDPKFLQRLFEIEIPEIYDGIIEIKGIAREPGERAKVAVWSHDERVDPVGACVGMKGVRIHSIVRELSNENIDVINYSPDPRQFIARALSPAKVKEISLDEETRTAQVLVSDDQVSLAIGKNGQNVRLAMKLTGFTLDLVREGGEDIELVEFKDEIGEDLYMRIIGQDIETAKEFLRAPEEMLLAIEGMNAEKLDELRQVMLAEFDEDELRGIFRETGLELRRPATEEATEEAAEGTEGGAEAATAEAAASEAGPAEGATDGAGTGAEAPVAAEDGAATEPAPAAEIEAPAEAPAETTTDSATEQPAETAAPDETNEEHAEAQTGESGETSSPGNA